ncbi:MAG: hypothetical protein GEU73_00395 [Chloroflexi bacterium]|nr:hypothetical protein [Chloroflexota bacterium]
MARSGPPSGPRPVPGKTVLIREKSGGESWQLWLPGVPSRSACPGASSRQLARRVVMAEVRVVVQFTADSVARADESVSRLAERSQSVQNEPGCLQFEVFRSVRQTERWALIELWESQEVLDERNRARGGPPPTQEGVSRTIEYYAREG